MGLFRFILKTKGQTFIGKLGLDGVGLLPNPNLPSPYIWNKSVETLMSEPIKSALNCFIFPQITISDPHPPPMNPKLLGLVLIKKCYVISWLVDNPTFYFLFMPALYLSVFILWCLALPDDSHATWRCIRKCTAIWAKSLAGLHLNASGQYTVNWCPGAERCPCMYYNMYTLCIIFKISCQQFKSLLLCVS